MYSSFKLKYVLKASQNEDKKHPLCSLLSIALYITTSSAYHEALCKHVIIMIIIIIIIIN